MKKIISAILFLGFTSNIFSVSRGPVQTEYISYESPDNSDMVDLKSGDFTYTLPLITTPGPSGGYTMALAYHAGIELEEEASWVGLGWTLNPGAIIRSVNQYPDDFAGEAMVHSSTSPGAHGYTVNWGVYSKYYDSNKGRGGRAGLGDILSVGFGNDAGLTVIGVNANISTLKVTADPVAVATSIITVALTAVCPPAGGWASAGQVAVNVGVTVASEVGGAMLGNAMSGKAWDGNITNESMVMKRWRSGLFNSRKNYSYYFRGSRTDKMYGTLYLGEAEIDGNVVTANITEDPAQKDNLTDGSNYATKMYTYGAVSDVSYNADDSYVNSELPTNLAYDSYSVFANGVAGSISPYRADVGSVAFNPSDANGTSDLDDNYSYHIKSWLNSGNSYKTQFRYVSELSNGYHHHLNGDTEWDPATNFKMRHELFNVTTGSYTGNDPYIDGQRINLTFENDYHYNTAKFIEANRTADNSFLNGNLATGKYIQYFTNEELADISSGGDPTLNTVYKDHEQAASRNATRSNTSNYPPKGIGGYVITNVDGTSYHFTIPNYQKNQAYNSFEGGSTYTVTLDEKVANTWLLSGITGPDYIDRNENGIIDREDWGYWVKMEYGNFNTDYWFHAPYKAVAGTKATADSQTRQDAFSIKSESSYYLDKITTPTHTSLFLKSIRYDNRSSYDVNNPWETTNSSLRLDEVVTITNEFADHFFKPTINGGLGVDYEIEGSYPSGVPSPSGKDQIDNVLNLYDLTTSQLAALRTNQIRSVKFNYSYDLCLGVPNSFLDPANIPTSFGGKLTLKELQFHGKEDALLSPPFEFDYYEGNSADNPDYDANEFDGWGLYQPGGSTGINSHMTTGDGDEWSLKEITTPTGSKVIIDYERDDYTSLAGEPLWQNFFVESSLSSVDNATNTVHLVFDTDVDLTTILQQGSWVQCNNIWLLATAPSTVSINNWYELSDVGANYIEFEVINYNYTGGFHPTTNLAHISFFRAKKKGGNLRVASISIEDENLETSTTRYIYTTDGSIGGPSSGVATMEPEFIHLGKRLEEYEQYKLYDFPSPFVMYGKVTVLSNYKAAGDYLSKEVYEFETPSLQHIQIEKYKPNTTDPEWTNEYDNGTIQYDVENKLIAAGINVKVMTSKIGMLKSQVSFNKEGHAYKKVKYNYTQDYEDLDFTQNALGLYTEASLLTERIRYNEVNYRNFQTLKCYVPTKMTAVTVEERGHTKTVLNTAWDFITGAVLETEYENAYGDRFRTQMKPAYTEYNGMGHLLWNSQNKHMLSKPVSNKLFVEKENAPGEWDLIAAGATVWSNQWSYREYNESSNEWEWSGTYTNDAWRQKEGFIWKANINPDGTYKSNTSTNDDFVEFNWANPSASNGNWKSLGSVEHYNHQSSIIEKKGPRGIYESSKLDHHHPYTTANAINAGYTELAYSGAESPLIQYGADSYFNDGVYKGIAAALETDLENVHTGKYSLEIENGEVGFIYKLDDLSGNYDVNKDYQVSAWVKNAINPGVMPTMADVYVQFRSGATILYQTAIALSATNTEQAGDWYRFTVNLPKHNGTTVDITTADFMAIQLRCFGSSGDKIYADDFRFYPLLSSVQTAVFDYEKGLQKAVLNNLNLTTSRVSYDAADRVEKVEREVLNSEASDGIGGFKLQQENKYNYGIE